MKTLTVQVDQSGVVRVPPDVRFLSGSRLSLVVAEPAEIGISGDLMVRIAQSGEAFDFLAAEPDLYSDADIEPGHENPEFGKNASGR